MRAIKFYFQNHFPGLYRSIKYIWFSLVSFLTGTPKHQRLFESMFKNNFWGDQQTRSGSGSNLINTTVIRRELPIIINALNAKSILDIPCGDFYWMKLIDLQETMYIGADIVRAMIEQNNRLFAALHRKFVICDLLNDPLPTVDVILCRDCLPHLPFSDIQKALNNIRRSGAFYLMTSNYTSRNENTDIEIGRFRPLNLMIQPFNFPPPIKMFNEKCVYNNNIYADKSMGLWKISEIPEMAL